MQTWICGLQFHHFSHFLGIFFGEVSQCTLNPRVRQTHLQLCHMDYISDSESIILFTAIHTLSSFDLHFTEDMSKILYEFRVCAPRLYT